MFKSFFLGFILFAPMSFAAGDHLKEKTFKEPLREVSVITSEDGFYPNKVIAFKGERIRFFVTSTTKTNQCFLLEGHKVFLASEKGKVSEGEIILEKAGRFKFYCPANKFQGHLTVVEKEEHKEAQPIREVASEKKPNYWLPRNYD